MWIPVTVFIAGLILLAAAIWFFRRPDDKTAHGDPVSDATEAPAQATEAPTPEPTEEPTPEPTEEPPAPTPSYKKTEIVVDGKTVLTMASYEAAEELLKNVQRHFEDAGALPDNAVTEPACSIELKEADDSAKTKGYDAAFTFLTGEDTPLVYVSTATYFKDDTIKHVKKVRYDSEMPKGLRFIESYGRDGVRRETVTVTYVNGVKQSTSVEESHLLIEPIDSLTILGTREYPKGYEPSASYGTWLGAAARLDFTAPIEGKAVKLFGPYDDGFHNGIDIAAKPGTEVRAACDGTVVSVLERGSYGLLIEIEHENGVVTRYADLSVTFVAIGSEVKAGAVIGCIAGDEYSSWLHFELRCSNRAYNPLKILPDLGR